VGNRGSLPRPNPVVLRTSRGRLARKRGASSRFGAPAAFAATARKEPADDLQPMRPVSDGGVPRRLSVWPRSVASGKRPGRALAAPATTSRPDVFRVPAARVVDRAAGSRVFQQAVVGRMAGGTRRMPTFVDGRGWGSIKRRIEDFLHAYGPGWPQRVSRPTRSKRGGSFPCAATSLAAKPLSGPRWGNAVHRRRVGPVTIGQASASNSLRWPDPCDDTPTGLAGWTAGSAPAAAM
jgi:hypothetical protein